MKRIARLSLLGFMAMGVLTSCGKDEKKNEPFEPKEPALQEDYTETAFGMNLEMVYVKGGTFEMGATAEQGDDANVDEQPIRNVKLDSYHIGKYEITQAQWRAIMGDDDPIYSYDKGKGDDYPVYYVSWDMAKEFCDKLSEQTGKKYVLPTEAMWEYAARGGVHNTKTKYAGSNDFEEIAWSRENSYVVGKEHPDYGTHPVGKKKANALGLYDMSGNVWEWCSDLYEFYDKKDDYNPQGAVEGENRSSRGGSWMHDAWYCRVSCRQSGLPGARTGTIGFRVACLS